jgi:DNA-binding response OmpR family regulator
MRILLLEDDEKIAEFVQKGLKQAGYAVDHVTNGEEAYSIFLNTTPAEVPYDLTIVDIMLPGMDGFTLIEKLRNRGYTLPVLILSAKSSVDERIEGLQKGGDDYLTKPFSFAELLARIQALLRRSTLAGGTRKLSFAGISMDLLSRKVTRNGEEIELQPKEFALLEYLMRNPDMVLSKTMILEHIWDYSFDPQTNVVDVLVHRLRTKIDKYFEKELIHTIRGVGYVLKNS